MKTLATLLTIGFVAAGCHGEPVTSDPAKSAYDVQDIKRSAAGQVADLLNDVSFRDALDQRLRGSDDGVMLQEVFADVGTDLMSAEGKSAALEVSALDSELRATKGISDYTDSLLEVRLIAPAGADAAIDWANIPVAFTPAGEESEWREIEAFTASGERVVLDPAVQPDFPVLVAGINGREDLRAGLAYVNDELAALGLQPSADRLQTASTSTETSKLNYIRLEDDQEPWISGKAEIYALVSGVDFDQDQVAITAVDMPYLDHDGESYTPNQILIFWETYRFAAANVLIYEHDDNTNYQTLVQALISAVEAVLDFTAPQYSIIARIANEIVAAMPSGWFSNDDDYVDSFYTLEKGQHYVNYRGAANNATITLRPYILSGN